MNRSLCRRGFSLAELVVSMGVAGLVLLMVVGVLGSGSEGFGHATRRIDANVEARAALSALAADLASAHWELGNFGVKSSADEPGPDELWCLALKPRRAQERSKATGDLCLVHYYTRITREMEGESGPFSRKLYRRFVSSSDVMAELKKHGAAYESPIGDPLRPEDEAIAFNVIDFSVRPMTWRDENFVDWNPASGVPPDLIEITLEVTDRRTASRLGTEADWRGETEMFRKILGNAGQDRPKTRTFTLSIRTNG